jgi:hypothetical protein
MDALRRFLNTFKLKRPVIAVAVEWWFHLNNYPVHTAAVVTSSMAARQFQGLQQPLYTPGSCRASFFLFPRVNRELASLTLIQETFQEELGVHCENSHISGLRHRLPALVRALREEDYQQLFLEKLKIQNALTDLFFLQLSGL